MNASTNRAAWHTNGPEEVADRVFRLPMRVGVRELHAVNVYVLASDDGRAVLIDAGDAAETTPDALDERLRHLGTSLAAVAEVLVTHVHPDHYSLAPAIRQRSGAVVRLGAGEQQNLVELNRLLRGEREPTVLDDLDRVGGQALASELDVTRLEGRRGPELAGPDSWLEDGSLLEVHGHELRTLATPGHTRGHVVFHDPVLTAWFTGDHVLPHITPSIGFESAPVSTALDDYLGSLRRLLAEPDGRVLPAHGPVSDSVHARARELLEHHEERLRGTLDAVADGGSTAYEVAERLRWTRAERTFPELDPWHRFLAATETAAHLEVLAARGAVTSQTPERGLDLATVFRPGAAT